MTLAERVENNRNKIAEYERKIAKKEEKLSKTEDRYDRSNLEYDIRSLRRKLEKAQQTVESLLPKLELEEKKLEAFRKAEKVLRPFMDEVIEQWDSFDKDRRARIKETDRKLREEFEAKVEKGEIGRYSWFTNHYLMMREEFGARWEELRSMTDEEIHAENQKAMKNLVIDLIYRIQDKAGEVTDYTYLHVGGNCLEGYVTGTKGSVEVRSILAGGWNIQRLHVRILVIPYKTNK